MLRRVDDVKLRLHRSCTMGFCVELSCDNIQRFSFFVVYLARAQVDLMPSEPRAARKSPPWLPARQFAGATFSAVRCATASLDFEGGDLEAAQIQLFRVVRHPEEFFSGPLKEFLTARSYSFTISKKRSYLTEKNK